MKIIIQKPLYETKDYYVVGIYDARVKKARERKEKILVECRGAIGKFDPEWIMKKSEIIEKVFRRPDDPMKLYKLYIPKKEKVVEIKLKKLTKLGIF